ncbi:MAG: DUF6600 domain-containing protein [Terriglobia bacterium]
MTKSRRLVHGAILSSLLLLTLPLWLEAYSYVRIVRLSWVGGDVYVERPGVAAPERALLNLPLVHDAALETADGNAEVEFESGALARLATDTRLHFTELALADTGGRITTLSLEQGTATFYASLRRGDTFRVLTPYVEVSVVPKRARFRVDLTSTGVRVRVFKGKVSLESPAGPLSVKKGRMFEWDETSQNYRLARNPKRDSWDEWNDNLEYVVHDRVRGPVPAHLRYGVSDLTRYGRWAYAGLCGGRVWQPWVAAGWVPFSYGRWASYPGFGWTWISFEPWGWLPYHYGSWCYDPFLRWVWVPDFFAAWSPARCYWVQRAGWIGWAPLPPQRQAGGTEPDSTEPPRGTLAVSEEGFGRGEVPRLAKELPEIEGTRWQFVDGPPAQVVESFRRTRSAEAVRVPAGTIQHAAREGRVPGSRLRPLVPGRSQPRSSSVRGQPGETELARPERVRRPLVWTPPAQVNDSERSLGRKAPTPRVQPRQQPRRSISSRPQPAVGRAPRPALTPRSLPRAPRPSPSVVRPRTAPRPTPRPAPRPAPRPPSQ